MEIHQNNLALFMAVMCLGVLTLIAYLQWKTKKIQDESNKSDPPGPNAA